MWLDFMRLKLSAVVETTTLIYVCFRENHIRFTHLSVSVFDRVLPVKY